MDPRQQAFQQRVGAPGPMIPPTPSPSPLPSAPMTQAAPAPATPQPEINPSAGAIGAISQARPNESTLIVKALHDRLKKLPPDVPEQGVASTSVSGMGGGGYVQQPQTPQIPLGAQIAQQALRESVIPAY